MPAIGLVLSAGGPAATAFHGGALAALAAETGWDPRTATVVVGTSAGSTAAALLRGGWAPADELARLTGRPMSPEGEARWHALDHTPAHDPPDAPPSRRPLGLRMALSGLPPDARPVVALAGLAPRGTRRLQTMAETVDSLLPSWPKDPLWICAVRVRDGRRVVFGRDDVPQPPVGRAVEASSAVPRVAAPVRIGRHEYVDGAVHSSTNADLVAGLGLDAVVVVSAMTAVPRHARCLRGVPLRTYYSRRLRREVEAVRAAGVPVLVVQPTDADLSMRTGGFGAVGMRALTEQAQRTTRDRIARRDATPVVAVLREGAR